MIESIIILFLLILILIYYLSQRKFNYWEKRKIPYIRPLPLLGNYGGYILMKKYMGQVLQSLCEQFPDAPYFGAFYGTEPTLVVQSPEMLKLIMTKEFYYFSSREISDYTDKEIRTQNLFFIHGDKWKVLRQNLTPLFSTLKMKNMFHLIDKCCYDLENMLDYEYQINKVQEVRSLMARYTIDCIGSCAFGIDAGTMAKESEENAFTLMARLMFLNTFYRGFKLAIRAIWPRIFYSLGLKCFPKESETFFYNLMIKVFAGRQYKPTNRNDFVDLILNMKQYSFIIGDSIKNMKEDKGVKIRLEVNDEMLVAQCVVFFAAGFETSSSTLQYTLYELAKNQEAQKRVLEEVDGYLRRHSNKLAFECITELPYTEACISEASRLYPVLGVLTREVVEDYMLPCGAVIEKGVRIHIPVYHLHHHPDYFLQPEIFRPERFLGVEKLYIKSHTFMPFGEGPRMCIGMRFAKMQMFAGIITVLKKYRVELAESTPRKLELTPTTAVTQTTEKIFLKFIEREGWEQRQLA